MEINPSIYVEASLSGPVDDISIWLKELVSALDIWLVKRRLVKGYTLMVRDEELGKSGSEEKSLTDDQPPTYEESLGDEKARGEKKSNRKFILSFAPTKNPAGEIKGKDMQHELSLILGRKMDEFESGEFKDIATASQKLLKDGWMSQLDVISELTYMYGRYYMRRLVGDIKDGDGEYTLSVLPKSDEEVENLSQEGKCGMSLKEMLDEYF